MRRICSRLPALLTALAVGVSSLAAQHVASGPWSGGVSSDAATIVARLYTPRFSTLEVSTDAYFSQFASFGETSAQPGDQPEISRFRAVGLKPSTRYYYRIRIGSQRDDQRQGSFTTLPLEGAPVSFRFALSSGASTGSDHAVFAEIKSANPLFYIVAGNLHDAATAASDRTSFRLAYEDVLASTTQGDLYRAVPVVYTWDAFDHGAYQGPVPARAAAHAAFREYVPHHPLADGAVPDGSLHRAFTVGRVRFLILDVRSERDPAAATLLGERQLAWLKGELLEAKEKYPLVFVVSPSTWLSPAASGRDDWGKFPAERAVLSDWLVDQKITGLCFLGGDSSALAADDGSNNRYGAKGGAGFPVLAAGPLDRSRTTGTGPWSHGPVTPGPGEGLFALIEVLDEKGTITVRYRGLNQHGHEKLAFSFEVPAPLAAP